MNILSVISRMLWPPPLTTNSGSGNIWYWQYVWYSSVGTIWSTYRTRVGRRDPTNTKLFTERLFADTMNLCSSSSRLISVHCGLQSQYSWSNSYLWMIKSQRCYLQPEHVTVCFGTRSYHSWNQLKNNLQPNAGIIGCYMLLNSCVVVIVTLFE